MRRRFEILKLRNPVRVKCPIGNHSGKPARKNSKPRKRQEDPPRREAQDEVLDALYGRERLVVGIEVRQRRCRWQDRVRRRQIQRRRGWQSWQCCYWRREYLCWRLRMMDRRRCLRPRTPRRREVCVPRQERVFAENPRCGNRTGPGRGSGDQGVDAPGALICLRGLREEGILSAQIWCWNRPPPRE